MRRVDRQQDMRLREAPEAASTETGANLRRLQERETHVIRTIGFAALGFCAGGTAFSILLLRGGQPSAPRPPMPVVRTKPRDTVYGSDEAA